MGRPGELRLGTFTPSVVLEVARRSGALSGRGVDVAEVAVPSSPAQFRALADGELDAVLTSPDNVLAYHFLAQNPLGERIPLRVEAAVDRGLGLGLWCRPDLDEDRLDGVTLGVDVAASGFAFVAYALLARRGLGRGDYRVDALGSTPARTTALLEGRCDLTVLNAGNQFRARAAGARCLGEATDLGPYLGTVLARLASSEPAPCRALADALLATAQEVASGHHVDTVHAVARERLGLGDHDAEEYRALLVDRQRGLVPSGAVDTASIRTLVSLRRAVADDPELDTVEAGLGDVVADGRLAP